MKKILLIIALTLCIFQMVVLATAITMGNPAIAGSDRGLSGYTIVDENAPADGTGTITTVEVYLYYQTTSSIVATFSADGNDLTARDYESVGNLAAGYHSLEVSLNVAEGDYIGMYCQVGEVESNFQNGTGVWYKSGDQTQCSGATFTFSDSYILSLKGTGTTAGEEANAIGFGTNF